MADIEVDTFAALLALYAADTGTGGLNKVGDNAHVKAFLRDRDRDASPGYPHIKVTIVPPQVDTYGLEIGAVSIRMMIVDEFNSAFTHEDAVMNRLRTVFDGVTPGTTGGWVFAPLKRMNTPPGGTRGSERFRFVQYATTASRSS